MPTCFSFIRSRESRQVASGLLLLFFTLIGSVLHAEGDQSPDANTELVRRRDLKRQMLQRLKDKLTRKDGRLATFVVFTPLDLTNHGLGPELLDTIAKTLKGYGSLTIKTTDHVVDSLTLEELRKLVIRSRADILVASSLKPASFDIYLYDSATPYYIYAYSEPIAAEARLEINAGAIPMYAKTAMRKVLFRFLQNQYFEIPRSDDSPVMKSEIPRWIASNESLELMQRDLASRFYANLSFGAAITRGPLRSWTSNLLGLQVGSRLYSHLYLEGALEAFSYNAVVGGLRYVFDNRDHAFGFALGLGLAYVTPKLTLNSDPSASLQGAGEYIVPSASVLLPIFDIFFTLESRLYLSSGKSIMTFMPGFLVNF